MQLRSRAARAPAPAVPGGGGGGGHGRARRRRWSRSRQAAAVVPVAPGVTVAPGGGGARRLWRSWNVEPVPCSTRMRTRRPRRRMWCGVGGWRRAAGGGRRTADGRWAACGGPKCHGARGRVADGRRRPPRVETISIVLQTSISFPHPKGS